MFTPTNDLNDPISFMDPYPSLLSPFTYFEMDGYAPNHYYYHDESLSAIEPFAESSNEPISASSKMKDHVSQGDINGIVEQDKSRNNHVSIKQTSRKRPSKGDRHSKIPTAQGLRDRRMRLSLDVARMFFDLQDMLSYDKASQTVKWLLLQAKPAIDKLKETKLSHSSANCGKNSPSASEGEEVVGSIVCDKIVGDMPKVKISQEKSKRKRKNAFNPAAKELRMKARERAKERTQTKKQAGMLNGPGRCLDEVLDHHQCHVRPIVALQIEDDSSSRSQNMRPSLDVLYKTEQLNQDVSIPFGTANWSQFMSLNYHQEDQTCHAKPLPEFQFHGASWEPYNHPHV